jgi:hypothetical protein
VAEYKNYVHAQGVKRTASAAGLDPSAQPAPVEQPLLKKKKSGFTIKFKGLPKAPGT